MKTRWSALRAVVRPLYRRLVPAPPPFARMAFAEQGEDILLQGLFARKGQPGFYVDVGAFHPFQYSVTQVFYRQGWRGINIEPRPGSQKEFAEARPRDINLELAVSVRQGTQRYFVFNEPVFNSLDPCVTADWQLRHGCHVTGESVIRTERLEHILDQHLPTGQAIDFLTIDVEGAELDVLRSNNWSRYRPDVILVEDLNSLRLADVLSTPVTRFLADVDYAPIGKTRHTIIYRLNGRIDSTRTD